MAVRGFSGSSVPAGVQIGVTADGQYVYIPGSQQSTEPPITWDQVWNGVKTLASPLSAVNPAYGVYTYALLNPVEAGRGSDKIPGRDYYVTNPIEYGHTPEEVQAIRDRIMQQSLGAYAPVDVLGGRGIEEDPWRLRGVTETAQYPEYLRPTPIRVMADTPSSLPTPLSPGVARAPKQIPLPGYENVEDVDFEDLGRRGSVETNMGKELGVKVKGEEEDLIEKQAEARRKAESENPSVDNNIGEGEQNPSTEGDLEDNLEAERDFQDNPVVVTPDGKVINPNGEVVDQGDQSSSSGGSNKEPNQEDNKGDKEDKGDNKGNNPQQEQPSGENPDPSKKSLLERIFKLEGNYGGNKAKVAKDLARIGLIYGPAAGYLVDGIFNAVDGISGDNIPQGAAYKDTDGNFYDANDNIIGNEKDMEPSTRTPISDWNPYQVGFTLWRNAKYRRKLPVRQAPGTGKPENTANPDSVPIPESNTTASPTNELTPEDQEFEKNLQEFYKGLNGG